MAENAGYAALTVFPSVRGIGAQMGAQLNTPLVRAGRRAGDELGSTLASRAGASIRRGGSQISGAVSTVAAGAAAAGGAALAAGFTTAMDMSAATGQLQSQLGVTEAEAGRIGAAAGNVYSSGFGASMPEVSAAVGSVVQNMQWMRDASSSELEEVSRQALNLANTLGIDVNEAARSVGNMVRTGIAPDAEAAMDLLVRGAQLGGDAYGDLADTMQEYSTQFRDLGLSGDEAMGLIVQAMEGGAQSSDKVGDSLKELNIRVKSLDTDAVDALGQLGLNADQMASAFAEGGPAARSALDEILGGLQQVPDEATRTDLAFALMGGQAEDMAGALGSMDLSAAAAELGDVAGAASDAADAVEDTDAAKLTSAWRELKTELGEELMPVLTQVATWMTANMDTVKAAGAAVLGLGAAWATYRVATTAATVATGAWNVGAGIVQGAAAGGKALGGLAARGRPALDGIRLRGMYAGDAIKSFAARAAAAARGGVTALASGARTAATAVANAGSRAATAARGGITTATTAVRTAGTAALASARSFTTLAVAQTRAALTATRVRVATIATAVAQRAVRAATIAWTGVQWLLNTALTANPIGLIVVGIGLLIGAVVLAYNKVGWFRDLVDGAFALIGAGATWLGGQVSALWTNHLSPAFTQIGAGATSLWTTYIGPAFRGIGAVISWVFSTVVMPVIRGYIAYVQGVLVPVALWLWKNVISPAFRGIGTVISWAWTSVIRPAFSAVNGFIRGTLAPVFTWLWRNVVTPAWNGIRSGISTAWSGIKTVFGYVRDGVAAVRRSFETARDGIGRAWSKVEDLTKAPAKFVVQSVYNEGILPVWNWVAKKVGLGELDKVPLPKGFTRGGILGGRSSWRQGDDQVIRARKGEAVAVSEAMRVPALRNELLRWNSIGVQGGTTALQRYAAGHQPPSSTPARVRDLAQGAGYAKGGIVDAVSNFGKDVVKGFLTGGLSGAVDKVAAPLVSVIKGKFGRSGFKGLPTRGVEHLVDGLKTKLKSLAGSLEISNGGAANWVGLAGASERLQRAARWVDTQVGLPYQWGGGGNPSWDCSGLMAGIENIIRGVRPARRYTTMSFRGRSAPNGWVQNMRSPFEVGVVNGSSARGSHMSGTLLGVNVESSGSRGVHKGLAARGAGNSMYTHRYGFAPVVGSTTGSQGRGGAQVYDDGGWLQPGYTTVLNATGRPEAVYTSAQQERIDRLVTALEGRGHRGHDGHTFHITGEQPERTARAVVTALSDWDNLHPVP